MKTKDAIIDTILTSVKEVEQRILRSLERPSSDGYMPAPVPAHIQGFKDANVVSIDRINTSAFFLNFWSAPYIVER